jgi:hypothetical protein
MNKNLFSIDDTRVYRKLSKLANLLVLLFD